MTAKTISKNALVMLLLSWVPLSTGFAQEPGSVTFNIAGGYAGRAGEIKDRLRPSGVATAGVGYRFTSRFSETAQFTYFNHRVSPRLLTEAGVPDGNARTWALTLDPMLHLFKSRQLPYLVGGIGYYRRTVEFTKPALVTAIAFDPFFNIFYRVAIPVDQVISETRVGGYGGSIGAGLDFKFKKGPALFAEARYHRANTGRVHTDMVPIVVGIRW